MRARSARMSLGALAYVLVAGATMLAAAPTPARLVGLRASTAAGRPAVVIEASAPVAYATSQPDPLTLLVLMRHVSVDATLPAYQPAPGTPVSQISVEPGKDEDGASVARVRFGLTTPTTPRVRSERQSIVVEFEEAAPSPVNVLGAPQPVARTSTPPAVAPAEPSAATMLSAVETSRRDGLTRITLRGNGYVRMKNAEVAKDPPPRIVLDFAGVRTTTPPVIEVGRDDVSRIRIAENSRTPLVTRVVIDLKQSLPYHVERAGEEGRDLAVVIGAAAPAEATATPTAAAVPATTVAKADVKPAAPKPEAKAPARPAPATEPVQAEPAKAPAPKAARPARKPEAAPAEPKAAEQAPAPVAKAAAPAAAPTSPANLAATPVSFDFQGVDLRAVLRTFAEITGLNVVIDPQVKGEVDVSLRDVPADQALEIILRTNQLGYTVDGTIVRIAPNSKLRQEEEDKRRLADAKALAGEMQLTTRTLSYAKADDVDELVKGVMSQRGRAAVDGRTNTIVMQDLPEFLVKAGQLLDRLDQPEQQVEIEARIVQTRKTFARELGVNWGFFGAVAPELGNTTPLAFPNNGTLESAVALGTSATPTGATKLLLGSVNGAFNLDVQLQALQRAGKLDILLTPRVVTQNNVKASIRRGEEIPYTTLVATSNGSTLIQAIPTVQFKTAALVLDVTPRITTAGTIILDVDVDNGSRGDFIISGNVSINTQRATTRVLVNDGATTVIGGIQAKTERDSNGSVPGLSRIPLFGRLFKNDAKETTDDEILIFITPRILHQPQARVMPTSQQQ